MSGGSGTVPDPDSSPTPQISQVDTPVGPARIHRWAATQEPRRGSLVLGHGAGGRSWSADLLALTRLTDAGWDVALIEQPWRVAGRKVAAPPPQLDAAWIAVLRSYVEGAAPVGSAPEAGPVAAGGVGPTDRPVPTAGVGPTDRPVPTAGVGPTDWPVPTADVLVIGGRSAGARVACRTAARVGADAVLALAFPLHPPGRPERSRAAELTEVGELPLLVVQGRADPFGAPDEFEGLLGPRGRLVPVPGGHGFSRDCGQVTAAVRSWLAGRCTAPT